jgi:hypothetical protein
MVLCGVPTPAALGKSNEELVEPHAMLAATSGANASATYFSCT